MAKDIAAAAADTIRRWRLDPVAFVRDNFQIEPDAWQVDALQALKPTGVNRICMKACAGPGKTAVLAWKGWWFLSCFGDIGQHPKGAAIATTADNLRDNLWPELSKWRQRSKFLQAAFEYQKERIFAKDHPDTWFLSARSFNKSADAQEQGRSLSGLHSEFPFVLIDESGDIAPSIGRAAEQAMGNCRTGMIAQAGNPTSMDGLLYESAITRRDRWQVITITADPKDPKRTPRVDAQWAKDQIEQYGEGNPWVMAYILGLFPPGGVNSLLTADEVEASFGRHLMPDQYSFAPKILGVDVARFGSDRSVIFPRQGLAGSMPIILRSQRSDEVGGRAAVEAHAYDADGICVDGSGGYGAGVCDYLHRANYHPHEIQFSGTPSDPRYFNKRSEMWWEMAQWVKSGGSLPRIPELVRELSAPSYWLQNGKLRLEEKDQIKSRLGWSPDLGDGLALTFAVKMMRKGRMLGGQQATGMSQTDFDPYA